MPATTCAFVTTSSDRAIQPEPSMPRPQAMPEIRTTLAGRRGDVRIPGDRRLRRRHLRRRPDEDAERIDAFERLEQPLGRKLLIDAGEDLGLLNRAAKLRLSRQVEEHRADGPGENEASRRAEQHARDGVEGAQAGDHAQRRAQRHAEDSREARQERPSQDRAAESNERRVGRSVARARSARCAPPRRRRARTRRATGLRGRALSRARTARRAGRRRARSSPPSPRPQTTLQRAPSL